MLILGGVSPSGQPVAEIEAWNPKTGRSDRIEARIAFPRWGHSDPCLPSGSILISGGRDGDGSAVRAPELFVPNTLSRTVSSGAPRVAVIGAGYWGKNIVRNFAALNALAAVVDENRSTAQALCAQHGAALQRSMRRWGCIDRRGWSQRPPPALYVRQSCAGSGQARFVEKPLALTLSEAEELVSLAEHLDRRLMVGHLLQYHPAFLKLKELVREGRLGRLQYLYSNRLNFGKIRREEDILWSFAPHDLSMILSLVGQEPETVECDRQLLLHERIADVTTTHLSFPGGERAHVFVSWLHPFKEQKLVVVGSEAMAVFDDGEPWERKLPAVPASDQLAGRHTDAP